jgi:DNA-binding transcriptional ArsR family regulator
MTPQETLTKHGIRLESYKPGRHYSTCPKCSHTRSKPKDKVLGITISDDGSVCWGCNHCAWTGPEKGTGGNGHQRQGFATTYDYRDGNGELIFQKVRNPEGHQPRFWCRRPDGHGGWINDTKGTSKSLYRWPEVIEALAQDHAIGIAEGEKDVDNLWRIGIPATCNFDGAADTTKAPQAKPKWKPEYSEQLRGAHLIVFNDNDPQGLAHAEAVCRMSHGIAARICRVDLAPHWPNMPKGADVSDWLKLGHTREELDALIARAPDYAPAPTTPPHSARMATADEIAGMAFAPIKYVVPTLLVEGLTLFAGKPKIGKSWLVLHAALAVARGGFTLGELHCIEGDVLYCALEDGLRRLQSRMTKLGVRQGTKRLTFCYEMPRLLAGGLAVIREWISGHPAARLIIIDTLAMVREGKKREESTYDSDYQAMLELRKLATEFGLAIVVIHHLRKADSDDAFDTVSGTLGLTGAPDSILILKRDGAGNVILHGKGRDLIEIEKAATFDRDSCLWRIEGDAAEVRRSTERTAVLEAIDDAGLPIGPSDIAATTGMRAGNVRRLLGKLLKEGVIEKERYGQYRRKVIAAS